MASWRRALIRREPQIDRKPQNLPVPMGGFAPVRQQRRPHRLLKLWRRTGAGIVSALGLILAAGAVVLTLTRPPVAVYADEGAVHVGSSVLIHPSDNGGLSGGMLYSGDASFVLSFAADRSIRAGAVTFVRGAKVEGACRMPPPTGTEVTEHCSFTIAGRQLAADDRLDLAQPGEWHRRYSDGRESRIAVPPGEGVIPVPFAIGE